MCVCTQAVCLSVCPSVGHPFLQGQGGAPDAPDAASSSHADGEKKEGTNLKINAWPYRQLTEYCKLEEKRKIAAAALKSIRKRNRN